MRRSGRIVLALLSIGIGFAGPAAARQAPPTDSAGRTGNPRWELAFGLLEARPVGELARYIDGGRGFRISGLRSLGTSGTFGIRLDATLVSYGKTSDTYALDLPGTSVEVDVTTENTIASVMVGPHVTLGHGLVRPYLDASIGSAQFATTTSAWSGSQPIPIAATHALERHTLELAAGGGLRIAPWERRRHPIAIEIDGRYLRHGRVEYLREGGIRELPDGSIELDSIVSDANLWTIHLGVVIGFR